MGSGAIDISRLAPRAGDLGITSRPTDPLASLVTAAAAGSRRATEALIRELGPRILGVARALLGPRHPDLDDLVQESLVAFVRALPAFEGRSSVVHYASRITVRVCIAGRRRARAEQRTDMDAQSALWADTTSGRPYRLVLRDRRRALVRLLLDDLPAVQSEALALRVCLGLPMEAVADITGAPLNTVYSRLRLAKVALRARIQRDAVLREMLEEL